MKPTGSIFDYQGSGAATEEGLLADLLSRTDDELQTILIEHQVPSAELAAAMKVFDHSKLAKAAWSMILRKRDDARWRPAEYETGIGYHGPWANPSDGFNEHTRRCALALAGTGVPVHLRTVHPRMAEQALVCEACRVLREKKGEHPVGGHVAFMAPFADDSDTLCPACAAQKAAMARLEPLTSASMASYSVSVYQVVPSQGLLPAILHHRRLTPEQLVWFAKTKVLSTVWERGPAPPEDVDAMNRAGQAWVACQQNADMLAESGVRPEQIRVIPIPFFDDDPLLKLVGRKRKPGVPRFYHIGKWEPRKAPSEIIGAFLQAFAPGEAELHMKTSTHAPRFADYPQSAAHAVFMWLEEPAVIAKGWTHKNVNASVKVYAKHLPASQIVALHSLGDVYVTLSHGEGFEMSAYDAKLAGNLMVYTPCGGPEDYATVPPKDGIYWDSGPLPADDERVVPCGKVPCHPWYGWAGASWMDFKMSDAIAAMRRAFRQVQPALTPHTVEVARSIGYKRVLHAGMAPFRAAAVGAKMKAALEEVAGDRPLWKVK